MSESNNRRVDLVASFANLSKVVNFDDFYNVNVYIQKGELTLQGHISSDTTSTAKKLGIFLEYDNECEMLKGETEDRKIRIVLT